jgi:hypothetical protein
LFCSSLTRIMIASCLLIVLSVDFPLLVYSSILPFLEDLIRSSTRSSSKFGDTTLRIYARGRFFL